MATQIEGAQLQVPERNLKALTFCDTETEPFNQWLEALPKTNLPDCSKKLGFALKELSRLDVDASELYGLVELVRPVVYFISNQISRHELPEGIIHTEQQLSLFTKCQQLHLLLLTVYKAIIDRCLEKQEDSERLASLLHRALSESHSLLLLMQEHYRGVPENLWRETHILIQIAEKNRLQSSVLNDPLTSKIRELAIEDVYKRMLLMSHNRSNQLRQPEIRQVNKALSMWAPHGKIIPQPDQSCWFMINTLSDEGLHYALTESNAAHPGLRGMDTRLLSAHLKKVAESIDGSKPESLSKQLIQHLSSAWGAPAQRRNIRHEGSEGCLLCYGSSATHYYLLNKQSFDEFVGQHSDTLVAGKSGFTAQESDVWEDAHGVEKNVGQSGSDKGTIDFEQVSVNSDLYPTFSSKIVNTSAGGYCLQLKTTPDINLVPGELVAVQEASNRQWMLASVRWVHAIDDTTIKLGAELLSAKTTPCAITPLNKTRDASHFQRCFMQAAMPGLSDQPTLVTPRLSFSAGMKFILLSDGKKTKGQLLECIESTTNYSQYQFRLLDEIV